MNLYYELLRYPVFSMKEVKSFYSSERTARTALEKLCFQKDNIFHHSSSYFRKEPFYNSLSFLCRQFLNRKWFGLVMDVSRSKLGLDGDGLVDILNVKLDDPIMVDDLIRQPGYMKGYHISRGNWISIILDGTVSLDEICSLLEVSYPVTSQKKKR